MQPICEHRARMTGTEWSRRIGSETLVGPSKPLKNIRKQDPLKPNKGKYDKCKMSQGPT